MILQKQGCIQQKMVYIILRARDCLMKVYADIRVGGGMLRYMKQEYLLLGKRRMTITFIMAVIMFITIAHKTEILF